MDVVVEISILRFYSELIKNHNLAYADLTRFWLMLTSPVFLIIIIIILSLTSIFFQDKSRVWTAASQQH